MIYVTGDTHQLRNVGKLSNTNFPQQKCMTRDDYLIICGDVECGLDLGSAIDQAVRDFHESKNYTTLFVGGNHENWDMLNSMPVEIWNGGKIHRITPHLIHLINGQVYTIEGKKFFVMGGARSSRSVIRTAGVDWWETEEPSEAEKEEGLDNLAKVNFKVDYVITHTAPEGIINTHISKMLELNNGISPIEVYLQEIADKLEFKHWFLGHLHLDCTVDETYHLLYNNVISIT